ncbi:hypothetical protein SOVF_026240 [Spinacia oleracea]|nr:hypothetical protein SOVF_026240 [Spinacia oleracea]
MEMEVGTRQLRFVDRLAVFAMKNLNCCSNLFIQRLSG